MNTELTTFTTLKYTLITLNYGINESIWAESPVTPTSKSKIGDNPGNGYKFVGNTQEAYAAWEVYESSYTDRELETKFEEIVENFCVLFLNK